MRLARIASRSGNRCLLPWPVPRSLQMAGGEFLVGTGVDQRNQTVLHAQQQFSARHRFELVTLPEIPVEHLFNRTDIALRDPRQGAKQHYQFQVGQLVDYALPIAARFHQTEAAQMLRGVGDGEAG